MTAERDRLQRVWDEQLSFLLELDPGFDKLSLAGRVALMKEYMLHAFRELGELLDEIEWKTWLRREPREPDVDALVEEAVDLFKLGVLNPLLLWGIGPDRFVDAFDRKTEVNIHRHLQHEKLSRIMALARRGASRPRVAALDLDGVLAAYPEHWLAYIERECELRPRSLDPADFSLVWGSAAVPRQRYAELKHAYRSGGAEALVPAIPGAVEFTHRLRAAGFVIVIVSARPVDRYKRLYSDTIRWLRGHGFAYDAVVWEPGSKEDRIIRDLPAVDFVLEDDPTNVVRLQRAGIRVFLMARPYNAAAAVAGAARVETFDELLDAAGVGRSEEARS